MDRIDEQADLASLLSAAMTFEASNCPSKQDWTMRMRKMLTGHSPVNIDEQRGDLLTECANCYARPSMIRASSTPLGFGGAHIVPYVRTMAL